MERLKEMFWVEYRQKWVTVNGRTQGKASRGKIQKMLKRFHFCVGQMRQISFPTTLYTHCLGLSIKNRYQICQINWSYIKLGEKLIIIKHETFTAHKKAFFQSTYGLVLNVFF